MKPVKVLYLNGNIMKRGGIEAFMMNYFRNIDHSKVHIDFVVHGYEKGAYDDEIKSAGSKIYHVPGGRDYDKVSPQNIVWFETEADAIAAGFRRAKQ